MSRATASRKRVSSDMLDYLIIALMGALGLNGAGWWAILIGAGGLTIGSWFQLYDIIRKKRPAIPLDWNLVGFYSASVANNLVVCAASYLVGHFGGRLTG
jgi:hypothetical protein